MALKKVLNLPCPFAGQERAYGVDEPPAWTDKLSRDVQEPLLKDDDAVQPFRREAPAPLRIASPRSTARAGSVDEDEICAIPPIGKLLDFARGVEQEAFDGRAGSLSSWRQLREAS